MTSLLSRFFISVFIAIACQGHVIASNFENRYNAHIHTENSAWSLRVNDVFVRNNDEVAYADVSPNIGLHLREGENTLSLLFSPVTGQDSETGEYNYSLHDGVSIDIAISRNQWTTGERERIHLVRMRYNEEEGQFEHLENTAGGEERVLNQPHLRSDGRPQLSEFKNIIFGGGWTLDGYRLDVTFTVNDPIPSAHWDGDAIELEDTPELRRELREAYQNIHAMIDRNDTEAIFQEVEPVWARTAYMLTERESARDFIENTQNGLAAFERVPPSGEELLPLYWEDNAQDDQVEFMANNRLVRIRPTPILWEHPPAGSKRYASFPVVFYKSKGGEWRVARILVDL